MKLTPKKNQKTAKKRAPVDQQQDEEGEDLDVEGIGEEDEEKEVQSEKAAKKNKV